MPRGGTEMATGQRGAATSAVPLVDHHAHSVVSDVRDRAIFESFLSESGTAPGPGRSAFCSFLGASLLRTCAPVLGLASSASAEDYLTCRAQLGGEEVNRRLLRAARTDELVIDHGFRGDDLLSPRGAEPAGGDARTARGPTGAPSRDNCVRRRRGRQVH